MDDNFILSTTLEYGQGYNEMLPGAGDEILTQNYDYTSKLGKDVTEYHITKINYSLNSFQGIQTLRTEYKNRNDGTTLVLLDTIKSKKNAEHEQEIEFLDDEEIIDIIFYITNDNRLTALSLKTNKNRVKVIGKDNNGTAVKDSKIKTGNYVIFGFGVQAGKRFGVSSIYCYYMHKYDYGIVKTSGFLQLRAKLKANKNFHDLIETQKNSLSDKHKLILITCGFPDSIFAEVAAFLISS
jgi:hypothetical protein